MIVVGDIGNSESKIFLLGSIKAKIPHIIYTNYLALGNFYNK